jgi:transglutaminase-like putative cysteine protease
MATTRPNHTTRNDTPLTSPRTPMSSGAPALLAALIALGAAAALALARVFEHRAWIGAALGAVVLPHAIGWYSWKARWSGWVTATAWIVIAWWYTIVAVVPHRTALGLPTPAAVAGWADALVDAPSILRSSTTPVAAEAGALLLALLAIYAANAAAHWSATRLDGALGAVVPTLALFIAISALGDGSYVVTTGVYAATTALFLLAQQQIAIGDRRTWFHTRPARRSRLVTGGCATVLAIAVLGALLGPQLPTAQSAGLLDYQDWGEGRGGRGSVRIVSPLVGIGDYLNRTENVELFTVQSELRTYWRLVALDNYDGDVWGLRDTKAKAGYPEPNLAAPSERITQRFEIGPMGGPFLPAAYQVVDTRFLSSEYSIHESASLFLDNKSYKGLRYEVDSVVPEPTATQLAGIEPIDRDQFATYLTLPDDFPESIARVASEQTAAATTPFEQALALQRFFRETGGFEYDTTIEGHDEDALERFVLEDKRGFCEQFSGSYAAMARAIGLPARVAVGFTPGQLEQDGAFHVTSDNAHAWPEVYFDGLGWTRFEPTPGRFEPTPSDYTGTGAADPGRGQRPGDTTTTTNAGGSTTSAPGGTAPNLTRPTFDINAPGSGASSAGGGASTSGVFMKLLVVLGIGLVLALGVVTSTFLGAAIRRRRRFRAKSPRLRVVGAWTQAIERLAEAGISRRPSATSVEFAMREAPAAGAGSAGPALLALAHLHTDALYSPDPPSFEDAETAWEHVARIEHQLIASTRRSIRWRRRIRPNHT